MTRCATCKRRKSGGSVVELTAPGERGIKRRAAELAAGSSLLSHRRAGLTEPRNFLPRQARGWG